MKEERPYKVFKIKEGVVIDHIPAGKALRVINVLGLGRRIGDSIITLGMNLDSKKMGKKDVVKIENKELSQDDLNKIVLIAPRASINIIKNAQVAEKVMIHVPVRFDNLIQCPNPKCVTNNHEMHTKFITTEKEPLQVKCHYCEKVFGREDVDLL
jgi:aspartate carbamoyltransferase regulatory subunit